MRNRSKGFRKTRPGIAILGEGLTEQYYFKHLKRIKGLHCTVEPRLQRNTSISSFEKNIEELTKSDIHVICVFDADVAENNPEEKRRLNEFRTKFRNNNSVTLCDSLPCLEYWFLLHFQNRKSVGCQSDAVIRSLRKHLRKYEKTKKYLQDEKWVRDMTQGAGSFEQAMKRAANEATLEKPDHCPYTNIHQGLSILLKGT
jgi:hypothetical protein